jgi:leucyl/phenylalanyl-tRNA--protein transferase
MPIFLLSEDIIFPPPHLAGAEGLLAVGGDLSEKRLLLAYKMGIFPWYSAGEPILWWSPDPRLVLFPQDIHISRSLKKTLKKDLFHTTMDCAFNQVMAGCAEPREGKRSDTWIVPEMMAAYGKLHSAGVAHSVEVWKEDSLVGGLYGVSLGGCFFGESMFSRVSNASKVALVMLIDFLVRHSFDLLDCQVKTDHLIRFGAKEVSRRHFLKILSTSIKKPTHKGKWP